MASAGTSKSKPKKSSNLRILWIPGRKKHNRKGICSPTKNGLPQTYGMQPRKIEPWAIGGAMNQSKIINADLHQNNLDVATIAAGGVMTLATTVTTGTVRANGVIVPDQQQQDHDRLQTEPMPSTSQAVAAIVPATQPQIVVGTVELNNLNGDAVNIKEKEISTSNQFEALTLIDEDDEEEKDRNCSNAHSSSSLLSSNNDNRSAEENNVHNAATLSIGEQHRRRSRRRSSQKDRRSAEDIDSIDQADSAGDVIDGEKSNVFENEDEQQRILAERQEPVVLRKRKNKRRSRRSQTRAQEPEEYDVVDGEEKKEPYEKAVTCLYWSLACWDCSIS